MFIKVLALRPLPLCSLRFLIVKATCGLLPPPLPSLPAPVAICCSCLKSSEATGEGRARYVQQTVEPGRSMSRIVSLYKSVSDNSPWPSACCWLLSHFTHSWGIDTLFTHSPGTPLMVTMGSHSPVENTDCIWQSLQVALHTLRFQWRLMFPMGVKWTTTLTPGLDFSWASIIHSIQSRAGALTMATSGFRFI